MTEQADFGCEAAEGAERSPRRRGYDGKEISDTRRYQMLGNSVAVPCVAFIMNGIVSQIQCIEKEVA